jgi:hypothetical protein
VKSCGEDTTPLRRALTAGLFPHAASKQLDGSYKVCWPAPWPALPPPPPHPFAGWGLPRCSSGWRGAAHAACEPAGAAEGSALCAPRAAQVLATGQVVYLHPSSVLLSKKPGCVVFNELVGVVGTEGQGRRGSPAARRPAGRPSCCCTAPRCCRGWAGQ